MESPSFVVAQETQGPKKSLDMKGIGVMSSVTLQKYQPQDTNEPAGGGTSSMRSDVISRRMQL